ncbi:MAG: hypothetical protein ACJAUP_002899 [Cellvibrionaceae bacterium]|jgi:hypothetical protein
MWHNLIKITLVSCVWRRYKRTIIALPLLLLYFWLVNLVHHDIIAYATLNNDTDWLAWSFLFKWLFILLGVAVFALVHAGAKIEGERQLENSLKEKLKKSEQEQPNTVSPELDGMFDRIRNKKSLRSKADIVLEKRQ